MFFGLGRVQISSKWKISKNKSHLFYGLNLWLNGFWPNQNFANYHPPPIFNKIISQERSASLMNFFLSNNSAEQLSLDFENQRLVTDAALENITGWRTFSGKMSWRKNLCQFNTICHGGAFQSPQRENIHKSILKWFFWVQKSLTF